MTTATIDRSGRGVAHEDVVAFLKSPAAYPQRPSSVEVIETHAALVFLAGREAYKIKKPVKLPYLDFSTQDRRKAACETEIRINRPQAPMIYLGLVPVCRAGDGTLQLGGEGNPVEWTVHMRRFPDDALMSSLAEGAALSPALVDRLADSVLKYHRAAPRIPDGDGYHRIMEIVEELNDAFAEAPDFVAEPSRRAFERLARADALAHRHRLDQRAARGYVRRCHGDLHLGNIVVLDGEPVPFDAIEFDETFATIDTLYDLAFLIMDLDAREMTAAANRVLNRYVVNSNDAANIAGLEAMPLFLACRAAIRAMVDITRSAQVSGDGEAASLRREIDAYVQQALGYLERPPARLICIGGLSGTGKTTVARLMAPDVGGLPGALHLRSDVERKLIFGVAETERLDQSAYAPDVSMRVYRRLFRKARMGLLAGFSVIIDAVFLAPGDRDHAALVSQQTGTQFNGVWLTAGEDTLLQRVRARHGDASDATVEVVRAQLAADQSSSDWHEVDADRAPEIVATDCLALLASVAKQ